MEKMCFPFSDYLANACWVFLPLKWLGFVYFSIPNHFQKNVLSWQGACLTAWYSPTRYFTHFGWVTKMVISSKCLFEEVGWTVLRKELFKVHSLLDKKEYFKPMHKYGFKSRDVCKWLWNTSTCDHIFTIMVTIQHYIAH